MADDVAHMHQWRSQARMAGLVLRWRDQRFDGDAHAYALAEAWRAQDKHLLEWQANQLKSVFDWRKNLYREFAAQMANDYAVAVLPKIDWRQFNRDDIEDETPNVVRSAMAECRRLACVSNLVDAIKHAMDTDIVECAGITACGLCGESECQCGLPKWESETINLLRRSLSDEQVADFFAMRSNQQAVRMTAGG
jgi:hypothetical protein